MNPKTPVLFRRDCTGRREVFALLPCAAGTRLPHTCAAYCAHGSGTADLLACIRMSRPATKAEYAPLARELRRIGYRLQILARTPRNAYALRCAQIK